MNSGNEILLSITPETNEDYENFRFLTESAFEGFPINLRKKLLFCITELIQNNYIHNRGNKSEIMVYRTNKQVIIESKQEVSKDNYLKIEKQVQQINNMDISALEELKINNIKESSEKKQVSPGNGLLTCRIKSGNLISININSNTNPEKTGISIFVKTDI